MVRNFKVIILQHIIYTFTLLIYYLKFRSPLSTPVVSKAFYTDKAGGTSHCVHQPKTKRFQ